MGETWEYEDMKLRSNFENKTKSDNIERNIIWETREEHDFKSSNLCIFTEKKAVGSEDTLTCLGHPSRKKVNEKKWETTKIKGEI